MPLYEYQCEACAHRFEQIRRFSDPPLESCPECGGAVRKLVSSPAFQFKGTGWYVTDYARQGRKDPADAASKEGAQTDGAASKSGEKGGKKSGDSAGSSDSGSAPSESAASPKADKPASAAASS